MVYTLTQLGYTFDLEADAVLSSTTRKLSPRLREQKMKNIQDRRLLSVPFTPSSKHYHGLRKSFKTAQAYADMIWKSWTRCYLPKWNQRSMWFKHHVRTMKEGELVWLIDDFVKRCEQKQGRINQNFTGNDVVERSAIVNMAHGVSNRKRIILSFVAAVSDPLGIWSPLTIRIWLLLDLCSIETRNGTKNCQSNTQNFSVIYALSWTK